MKIHDLEVTGSLIYNGVNLLSLTSSVTDSGSFSAQIVNLNQVSSSLNSFTSSINTTIKNKLDSESVISGSAQVLITGTTGYSTFSSSISNSIGDLSSSVGSLSSSIATTTSNLSSRIGSVETKTGSYATTGSNIFVGSQVITGSLYITNDMVVQGCSCLQNITASAVSIGTNTVVLNTATPAVRFAGVSVQDSGSNAGVTGSIYWDGLCNRWVYSNPSGIGYSGGMLLSGPRTSTLGSESPLTCNYIAKSGGGDHLYDSCIYEISGSVGINCSTPSYNLDVSGCGRFSDTLRVQHPSLWGAIELVGSAANQGGQVDFYGGTTRYATITGEQESTNNGQLIYRTLKSNVLTNALSISSTGVASFAGAVCVPNIISTGASGGRYGTFSAPANGGYITFDAGGTAFGDLGSYCAQYGTGDATTLLLGSRTGYALALGTNSVERMRITACGNVGIGTNSPDAVGFGWTTLTIKGGTTSGSAGVLELQSPTTTGAGNLGIIAFLDGSTRGGQIYVQRDTSTTTSNMLFATNGGSGIIERMRISSAGTFGFNCSGVSARTMVVKGATGCPIVAEFIEPAGVHSIYTYPNKNCTNHISSDYMSGGVFLPLSLSGRECTTDLVLGINGNIGINNSNPLTMLQVSLTPNAVAKTRNTCFGSCGLVFLSGLQGTTNSEVGIFGGNDFGSLSAGIGMARANSGDWDTHLRFYTHIPSTSGNPADITEKMRIIGNGNVGIGLTVPGQKLSVQGDANNWTANIIGSTTAGQSLGLLVTAGLNSNDVGLLVQKSDSSTTYFQIRGDGFLFSSPTYNNLWPGYSANMYVTSDGSFGRITASSLRYKENINEWNGNGLDTILALKPKTFKYKKDYYNNPDNIDFLGLIAEDVAEVLPYLAQYENIDRTGLVENVRYDTIVVPLIAAIQEQQCIICSQSSMINTLKTCLGIM